MSRKPIAVTIALTSLMVLLALRGGRAMAATLTVTSALDPAANDGLCTLREAMLNVNAATNVWSDCTAAGTGYGNNDTINFNIGGGISVKTITPTTPFPPITKPVTIDASTQPGAALGTNLATYPDIQPIDATVMVEIDCAGLGDILLSPLTVAAGGNGTLIRGLSMGNFHNTHSTALITLQATGYVFGNFLGLRADGATSWPGTSSVGVTVAATANGSYVGTLGNTGSSGATRNVISSCDVGLVGSGAQTLVVNGNIFGLTKSGTAVAALPGYTAIYLDASSGIAPYQPDIRFNVVSGHLGNAVLMGGVYHPTFQSNLIGMGLGSPQPVIGNGGSGIVIANATPNLVAQGGSYSLNTIAGSGMDGITVIETSDGSPSGNGLTGNSIFGNAGLGINLEPSSEAMSTVTPNDPLDADPGPNGRQNFPVVTSAVVNGSGAVVVQFTLNSAPSGQPFNTFAVSAYASPACSAKGHGEGRYFGGNSGSILTDASGNVSGSVTVPAGTAGWTAGSVVTLLAHDVFQNNTSEFSACMVIAGAPVTAAKVAFVQQPTNAVAGAAISPSVTVQLQDAGNAPVAQSGVSVTLTLASGTGALSGTATQTTDASGLATFGGLSVNLAGTKTLSAASAGLSGATSGAFVISAGAGTTLSISGGNPQSALVGTAFGSPLQVLLTDGLGNPVSGAQVSFTAPGSGASAALATSPVTTDATGHAQVTATANATTGSYTVTAASGTLPAVGFNLTNVAAPSQAANVPALGGWGLAAFAIALSGLGARLLGRISG